MRSAIDDTILNFCMSKVKNYNIDRVVKIEGWQNLNTNAVEKISVLIADVESNKQSSFNMKYDENIDIKTLLKNIVVEGINLGYIKKESVVSFIFDKSISLDYSFGMVILEVSRVLYKIARFKLNEFIESEEVLEKILKIAEEIKKEGREGKKVGTLFVIGDEVELSDYTRPLILNPFFGYPENLRDILNNDLTETIKEYAQLDGAFIITNKGIVVSAGTYIDINTDDVKKYYGWGTKHLTASAITLKTKSVAVLVSESGNVIKLFKNGKLVLKY